MSNTKKTIISSLYLIGNGVLQKLVGLISTLILARILLPDDFAVVAIAMLVITFSEIFSQTGSVHYIVSRPTVDDNMINSAWTLDLFFKLLITLFINLIAYPASTFYNTPDLQIIIHSLSILPLLAGLRNPGLWIMQREQSYKKQVSMQVGAKVCAVGVSVSVALIYESYWALILGQLTTYLILSIFSYVIHPYRPKLRTEEISQQLHFSAFMIPQEIFGYIKANVDAFIISKHYSKEVFGSFHVMKYLAVIPSMNFIQPMSVPLLVEMAKDLDDKEQVAFKYSLTFLTVMLVSAPISIFIYQNSYQIVAILLGENWLDYHLIFAYMGWLVCSFFVANHCKRILMVLSKTQYVLLYEFLTVVAVIFAVVFNIDNSITILIKERVIVELVLAAVFLITVSSIYLQHRALHFFKIQTPAVIVFIATFIFSQYMNNFINLLINQVFLNTLVKGITFIFTYIVLLALSFLLFYRKTREGLHLLLLTKLNKVFNV